MSKISKENQQGKSAKNEDLVALVVRCRELYGSEKRLADHGAVDFGSILG